MTEGEGGVEGASWRSRTGGECGAMSGARVVLKEPRHESREFVPRVSGKAANRGVDEVHDDEDERERERARDR